MLRTIRCLIAIVVLLSATILFADVTGLAHVWLGWVAKIQFLPSLLALNFAVVIGVFVLTLVLGRIYCSVICPLGIMQDAIAYLGKKAQKNRYSYSRPKTILRWCVLALFVLCFIVGAGSFVALLAPYSSFGRIAQNLVQPVWGALNNSLAQVADHYNSYAFYDVEVWVRSGATFAVSVVSFAVLAFLSWRGGRTYCNTICPVGTILGVLSRYSIFAPVIDKSKCVGCRLCERNCKASCIDIKGACSIDGSRCVACMDCIERCPKSAVSFTLRKRLPQNTQGDDANSVDNTSRRSFLTVAGVAVSGAIMAQKDKVVDGGLTVLEDKVPPRRETPVVPPGAQSIRNFQRHCTGCQLCVAQCPNHVLRPQVSLLSLMQPEMSFEKGYCRPECTTCSSVCPAGAILEISAADKSAIHVGHAVWVRDRCVVLTDGVKCGNCASHCPVGAISMVLSNPADEKSARIPAIDTEACIGCGACEHLCPSRPLSAIFVEGHENHRVD